MYLQEKCSRQGCEDQELLEHDDSLLLFVSFSMPEEAFIFFSKELEFFGGSFVLRGIPNNSFPEFFRKIKHLRDIGIYAPFSIDPDLFEKYSSDGVPTLLLTSDEGVDKVVGNLPIRDSLEKISRFGDNKQLAKEKLFQLSRGG
ncbi:type-F conjugative transfer system pilin assembly protein TrbC [Simkania negevensis]|nr:type-F conjugative transfer system pilin assembly protein TrbC [Simkania negevensis]